MSTPEKFPFFNNTQSSASPTSGPDVDKPEKNVMNVINRLADDGSKSKFMDGHLDENVMHDTFLVTSEHRAPDSTLAINCQDHNKPAVFFSQKLQSWRCWMCMIEQDGLKYVERKYKFYMDDFEKIKATLRQCILENSPSVNLLADWKKQIRAITDETRLELISWVESYLKKFIRTIHKIEQTKDLVEYADSDHKVQKQMTILENKYKRILQIFETIQSEPANSKLEKIESYCKEMDELNKYVMGQDKSLKSHAQRVRKALYNTIDLEGLHIKLHLRLKTHILEKM
jgi:hypothetical protein